MPPPVLPVGRAKALPRNPPPSHRRPGRWGDGRRARIGLLGGSFNPAHAGHRHVADMARHLLRLDEVFHLEDQLGGRPATGQLRTRDVT